MIFQILILTIGFILLVKGSDLLVDGAKDIALHLKVSPLIIGLTLCAIGTSLPELYVSLSSSIKGLNDMSLGNIIGSNIFDILIVLGITSFFGTITISSDMKKIDIPSALGISIIVFIFCFITSPLQISRIESIILLLLFFLYVMYLFFRNRHIKTEKIQPSRKLYKSILITIIGLAGIIIGGELTLKGAKSIAEAIGISDLIISLTIVAAGTSLPELVTSITAIRKKESDIALGNAVGSTIFNIILILSISGIISPIALQPIFIVDTLVMILSILILLLIGLTKGRIRWYTGIVMILLYSAYIAFLLLYSL